MPEQILINNGITDNDPNADSLRVSFGASNLNFTELFTRTGSIGVIQTSLDDALVTIAQNSTNVATASTNASNALSTASQAGATADSALQASVTNATNITTATADSAAALTASNTNTTNVTALMQSVTGLTMQVDGINTRLTSYQSIADLEAARPALSQEARSISRVTNDPDFGFMEVVCVDLGNGKQWLPYPKILDDSVRMGWGDFTGFTAGSFADLTSTFLITDIDLRPPTATVAAIEEVKHLFPLANIRISSSVISSGSSASANVDARISPLNSVQFIAITSASLGGVSRDTSSFTLTHDDLMANVRVRATNSPSSSSVIFVLNHLAR